MKTAKIVVDALYGDGGKGLLVHNLVEQEPQKTLVVRFSGGQQAGHTVIHNEVKHVFSSFGAGTLLNVPSYFSEHTCILPPTLNNERDELLRKGFQPTLFVDSLAQVTTPYDVAHNRACQKNRNDGTCGLGVGATFARASAGVNFYAIDLMNPFVAKQKMLSVQQYYDDKLNSLYSEERSDSWRKQRDIYYDELQKLRDKGWFDCYGPKQNFEVKCAFEVFGVKSPYENFVFEGSQGILLDQKHGFFPHVTYANTTSKNALEICERFGIEIKNINYVTRCYQTRHGSGPFAPEANLSLVNTEEEINKTNPYQKNFRIAPFDEEIVLHAIRVDMAYHSLPFIKTLTVSCLDQMTSPQFDVISNTKGLFKEGIRIFGNHSPKSGNRFLII